MITFEALRLLMGHYRPFSLCLAFLFITCQGGEGLNPSVSPIIDKGEVSLRSLLDEIRAGLDNGHVDDLKLLTDVISSSMFVGKPQVKRVVADSAMKNREYLTVFGPYVGVEEIGYVELGATMRSYVFTWKMKEAAILWYFNFYRSSVSSDWRLISFTSEPLTEFLDRPEKLFQLGDAVRR